MATERQIIANRGNAKKSTGPRTGRGKALASMNALKHGLTAQTLLIPGESAEEFEALVVELYQEHRPETASERQLVDLIATLQWRLRRAATFEPSLLNPDAPIGGGIEFTVIGIAATPDPDLPPEAQCTDEEDKPCLGYTEDGHKIVRREEFHIPPSYQPPKPLASRLSDLDQVDRHQTSLLNALMKTFHLLFVLQSRRLTGDSITELAVVRRM
jgi:hypothetical protein